MTNDGESRAGQAQSTDRDFVFWERTWFMLMVKEEQRQWFTRELRLLELNMWSDGKTEAKFLSTRPTSGCSSKPT